MVCSYGMMGYDHYIVIDCAFLWVQHTLQTTPAVASRQDDIRHSYTRPLRQADSRVHSARAQGQAQDKRNAGHQMNTFGQLPLQPSRTKRLAHSKHGDPAPDSCSTRSWAATITNATTRQESPRRSHAPSCVRLACVPTGKS